MDIRSCPSWRRCSSGLRLVNTAVVVCVAVLLAQTTFMQPCNAQTIFNFVNSDQAIVRENTLIGTSVIQLLTEVPVNGFYLQTGGTPFTVEQCTGVVEVSGPIDRERQAQYTLEIEGNSSASFGAQQLFVTVLDVNDNKPGCASPSYSVNVASNHVPLSALQFELGSDCVDLDQAGTSNSRITYVIVSGNDRDYFRISALTGQLTLLKSVQAASAPKSFTLVVELVDDGVPRLSSRVTLQITVTPSNVGAPVFNASSYAFSVPENDVDVFGTVYAVDPDISPFNRVTYRLKAEHDDIRISPLTGALHLNRLYDYERDPTMLSVEVVATDSAPVYTQLSSSATVTITIVNVNEDPMFVNPLSNITVSEVAAVNTSIGQFQCQDVEPGTLYYSILPAVSDSAHLFSINSRNGTLSVASPLNADILTSYYLVIGCTDAGSPPLSTTTRVHVILEPVNEHSPIFNSSLGGYVFYPAENTPPGTTIGAIHADDKDTGVQGKVFYSLAPPSAVFSLNNATGDLQVTGSLDYETQPTYSLTAVASDRAQAPSVQRTTTTSIAVNVVDLNDNMPMFSMLSYSMTITTSYAQGQSVLAVSCSDVDTQDKGEIRYFFTSKSFASLNFGKFQEMIDLDSSTGLLFVKDSSKLVADTFLVNIGCQDKVFQKANADVSVTIRQSIPNLHSPLFNQVSYNISVRENTTVGTVLTTIRANDSDAGLAGNIIYSLQGADTDVVSIDNQTGQLTLATPLDYEQKRGYSLLVNASDQGDRVGSASRSTAVPVNIIVLDYPDPGFLQHVYTFSVKENDLPVLPIGNVRCLDQDGFGSSSSAVITYQTIGTTEFLVDSLTGAITLRVALDYDTIRQHNFTVTCQLSNVVGTATVTVDVQPENEHSPKITALLANTTGFRPGFRYSFLSMNEFWPVGFPIFKALATDTDSADTPDGQVYFRMTQRITPSSLQSRFSNLLALDNITGQATVAIPLQHINGLGISFRLYVVDGKGMESLKIPIYTSIQDTNNNAPKFVPSLYNASVPEDSTVGTPITPVECVDGDVLTLSHGKLSMQFTGGNSHGYFELDVGAASQASYANTTLKAVVKLKKSIYRVPAAHFSDLKITCSDSGTPSLNGSADVVINVLPIDLFQPVFTATSYAFNVSEGLEVGGVVGRVAASDNDTNPLYNTVRYRLVNAAGLEISDYFRINASSGVVTLNRSLDSESTKQHLVRVEASDGTRPSFSTITINVIDVNDNPPAFTRQNYSVTVPGTSQLGFVVLVLSATDRDTTGVLSYSVSSGTALPSWLSLAASTGVITLTAHPPAGLQSTSFQVMVSDGRPGVFSNATVHITLFDAADIPLFTDNQYLFYVVENTPVPPGGLQLTDDTITATSRIQPLLYSIVAGNVLSTFSLRPNSALFFLDRMLDRESIPVYLLKIQADAGKGIIGQSLIDVRVQDINDNAPSPAEPVQTVTLLPSHSTTVPVATVQCTDPDNGNNGTVTYHILSGNERGHFALNSTTGQVKLTRVVKDNVFNISYTMDVQCADMGTPHSLSNTFQLVIDIDFKNEAPVFIPDRLSMNISESLPVLATVYAVTAGDPDNYQYGRVSYSITSGNTNGDFAVNPATGSITVAKTLDRETTSSYTLVIEGRDGAPRPLSDFFTLSLRITDVNDNRPTFNPGSTTLELRSRLPVNSVVYTLGVTDADLGTNAQFQLSLNSGNADSTFYLNSTSRQLILAKPFNRTLNPSFFLTIRATDLGSPPLASNPDFAATVNVLGSAPVFKNTPYQLTLEDNLAVQSHVVTVLAEDSDTSDSSFLFYDLVSGNIDMTFSLSRCTGEITLSKPINAGITSQYTLIVSAAVRGQTALATNTTVVVDIVDKNEAPQCQNATYNKQVYEGISDLGRVVCVDRDVLNNSLFTYMLSDTHGNEIFIDSLTGDLKLPRVIHVSTRTCYNTTIIVQDKGSPPLTTRIPSQVCVLPRIQLAPASRAVTVSEATLSNTLLETFTAVDLADPSATPSYSITAGNVGDVFAIDSVGEVVLSGRLDFEILTTYNLTIQAYSNSATASLSTASSQLLVTVLDSNDNAPVISPSHYVATFNESVPRDTIITTFQCTDKDSDSNGRTSFSIAQGNQLSAFIANATSGQVILNEQLDYENSTQRSFQLTVRCSDSGTTSLFSLATLVIQVTNVNEHPPAFVGADAYHRTVSESAPIGERLLSVSAVDLDQDIVKYSLVTSGSSPLPFTLDSQLGRILVSQSLDYDVQNEYTLTVQATDGSLSTLATVNITVSDANNHVPEFNQSVYNVVVQETSAVPYALLTVACSDGDHGSNAALNYTILRGSHSSYVSIDSTGHIQLVRAADFETLSSFSVELQCFDHGTPQLSSTAVMYVQILGRNEHTPAFSSSHYNVSVPETFPQGSAVTVVTATDNDKGADGSVTLSLVPGPGSSLFQLISASGELVLSQTLDFETQRVFFLTVSATDAGGLQSNASLTVNVIDVNDIQPLCNPIHVDVGVMETAPTGSLLTQLQCTDGDAEDAQLAYSFSPPGSSGSALFQVNSTGAVLTKAPLDADQQAVTTYDLTVAVQDGVQHTVTVTIRVRILPVNEFPPVFSMPVYSASVREDLAVSSVVLSVNATDKDAGVDGMVVYSWLGRSSLTVDHFRLDASTGGIQLVTSLDYETDKKTYSYTVVATDRSSSSSTAGQRNATARCDITLADVNDNAPIITKPDQTFTISANQTGGELVAALQVTDADSAPFSQHTCTIVRGNTGNLFSLTGDLNVIISPSISSVSTVQTSGPVNIDIQCVDSGDSLLNSMRQILITITEVNLHPPVFNATIILNITVPENVSVNTAVLTVHATDPDDVSNPISYTLSRGNTGSAFSLDASSGVLQVARSLDHEQQATYAMTITAADSSSGVSRQSFATVYVTVEDLNDNLPVLTPSSQTISIDEGKPAGSYVGQVTCTDADSSSNGQTTVYVVDGQPHVLLVNSTGAMSLNHTLNYGQQSTYFITMMCSDGGLPSKSTTARVVLLVIAGNRNAPVFQNASYSATYREDVSVSSALVTVNATDADSGSAGELVYTLISSDGGAFSLGQRSGVLSLLASLDYEKQRVYHLVAEVNNPVPYQWSCSQFSQSQSCPLRVNITITVSDVNDNTPRCITSQYNIRLNETVPVGTQVQTLTCSDADEGLNGLLSYSLLGSISQNPGNSFDVNATSGAVYVKSPLDKLLSTFYNIWIEVQDSSGSGSRLSTRIFVYVEVIPVNLYRPVFAQPAYSAAIIENAPIGSTALQVNATDADQQTITYSLGTPSTHFLVQASTGEVLTSGRLDREVTAFYQLIVRASDNSQPVAFISQTTVNITILDYNDHVPTFQPEFYSQQFNETPASGTAVPLIQLSCTDGDQAGTNNTKLSYRIIAGNTSMFQVGSTGLVSLAPAAQLDYEQQRSHGLTIECSDAGQPMLSSNAIIVIGVLPVNEFSPVFAQPSYDLNIAENAAVGQTVTTLTAMDGDSAAGPDGKLTYKIISGNSAGIFFLDEISAAFGISRQLAASDPRRYSLTVRAMDGGGRSSDATVHVNVTDLNNNDPECSKRTYSFKAAENVTGRVEVGRLSCTDRDIGASSTLRYTISAGDTSNQFSIENSTGRVYVVPPLNRARQAVYSLVIIVADQGSVPRSIQINVLVEVLAVNRFQPAFVNAPYNVSVPENALSGTLLLNITAQDADSDEYGQVTYSIESGNDGNAFVLDAATGSVYVSNTLDWETQSTYLLTIKASDGAPGSLQLSSTTTLSVTVININDNTPTFSQPIYAVSLALSTGIGSPVTQVSCSDKDSGASSSAAAATYAITGGNTDGAFSLNSTSGVVTVQSSLLSLPGAFVITVQCTDMGPGARQSALATIAIVLESRNNFAPVFTQTRYAVNVSESAGTAHQVVRVSASDADAGDSGEVTYSIQSGNALNTFFIDPDSGNISLVTTLDRETTPSYLLEVQASDGGVPPNVSVAFVSISVLDINDNTPVLSPQVIALTPYLDDTTLPKQLLSLTCTDADFAPQLSISLNSSDSTVVSALQVLPNGQVSQQSYVSPGSYRITAVCSDGALTSRTTTISLTVNPSAVRVPAFQQSLYNIPVIENRPLSSELLTLQLQNSPPTGMYAFSITSGNIGNHFQIGSLTGELHLLGTVDREVRSLYDLTITASPAFLFNGSVTTSTTQVRITVTDVNDQTPTFVSRLVIATANESAPIGSTLASLQCTDADQAGTDNARTALSIITGNAKSQFGLRPGRVPAITELWLQRALDYETSTFHSISVKCQDSASPVLSSTAVVALTVTPINENEPVFGPEFNNTVFNTSVYENVTLGTVVITVSAVDADVGGSHSDIQYSLTGGSGVFVIDSQTGAIRLQRALDASKTNYYVLTVTAMDNVIGGAGSKSFSSQAVVGIAVLEARQDHRPVLVPETLDLQVNESTRVGTVLAKFTCTDGDGDSTLVLIPTTQPHHSLVSVNAAGDLVLAQALDYENTTSYSVRVTCTDQRAQPLIDISSVTINVLPVNEYTPTFNATSYRASVPEDTGVGSTVVQVFATDLDAGNDGSFEYSIVSGNEDNTFRFFQGSILVDQPLDYENVQEYDLVVSATEDVSSERYSTRTQVTITVVNVNDNTPACSPSLIRVIIPANAGTGYSVATLNCTDPDDTVMDTGNSSSSSTPGSAPYLNYTIVSDDTRAFAVSPGGELQLLSHVSSRTEQHLQVQVLIRDLWTPSRNSTVLVIITVLGRADASPMFEQPLYSANVSDTSAVNTSIVRVRATDADVGQTITYSLNASNPSDLQFFAVHPQFGLVYLSESIRSTSSATRTYSLVVVATDNGIPVRRTTSNLVISVYRGGLQFLTVRPPFENIVIQENTTVGAHLAKLNCTDNRGLANARFQVSLVSGNTLHTFRVSSNGVLSLFKPLNDSVLKYSLSLLCFDADLPSRQTATSFVQVVVVPLNNHAPVFDQSVYNANVLETAALAHYVTTVHAHDQDYGSHGQLHYFIVAGNTNDDFFLDEFTGVLSVSGSLDRETVAMYRLGVQVTDTDANGAVLTASASVFVSITDVNDERPVFVNAIQYVKLPEDLAVDTVVANVTAYDQDIGTNSDITFTLTSGNVNNTFRLIQSSNDTADIVLAAPLAVTEDDAYRLEITAQDGGSSPFTAKATVFIGIDAVNDFAPQFAQSVYHVDVKELTATGSAIVTVSARDADQMAPDGTVNYRLLSHRNVFFINSHTGEISLDSTLDYELTQQYNVSVEAFDLGSPPLSTRSWLIVTVVDENDNSPACSNGTIIRYVREGNYSSTNALELATLACRDADAGANARLTYRLLDTTTVFSLNSTTGVLSVMGLLDASVNSYYSLSIVVQDNGVQSLSFDVTAFIVVNPVNDHAPVFTQSRYSASIAEDARTLASVAQVTASDDDTGFFGVVHYQLVNSTGLSFSPFSLDSRTGNIYLQSSLDYERTPYYVLMVEAYNVDPRTQLQVGGIDTATVRINVTDVNDNAPVFSESLYNASVMENGMAGEAVVRIEAVDADAGSNADIVYRIVSGNTNNAFTVYSNGSVVTTHGLDYEQRQSYRLVIMASDRTGSASTDVASICVVNVQVENVNDNAPIISPQYYTVSIPESSPPGTNVVHIIATDADNTHDVLTQLQYSVSSMDVSAGTFIISSSGQIRTNATLDYEQRTGVQLRVNVSDGMYSAMASVSVTILDSNDNSPVFQPPSALSVSVMEGVGSAHVVTVVFANDTDHGSNGLVTYTLLADNSTDSAGQYFSVDSTSGTVSTLQVLHYKNNSDVFLLLVQAQDAGIPARSSVKEVIITIMDMNDNAPIFEDDHYVFNISEGSSSQSVVGAVLANDADAGLNSQVVYRIVNSTAPTLFTIDPSTGLITTTAPVDREQVHQYRLTIQASDMGQPVLSSTSTVTVYVQDINDSPPFFDPDLSGTIAAIAENSPADTLVVVSSALDGDADQQQLFYSMTVVQFSRSPAAGGGGGGGGDGGSSTAEIFTINNSTGEIRTVRDASPEDANNAYNVTVVVDDGIYNSSQSFQIVIGFVNRGAPVFSAASYYGVVQLTAQQGVLVSHVLATDSDSGTFGRVTYSIANEGDALYASYFGVSSTGEVQLSQSLSAGFEMPENGISLTVRATDGGGLYAESQVSVLVYASDNILELWFAGEASTVLQQDQVILAAFNEIVTYGTNQLSLTSAQSTAQLPSDVIQYAHFSQQSTSQPTSQADEGGNKVRKRRQLGSDPSGTGSPAVTTPAGTVASSAAAAATQLVEGTNPAGITDSTERIVSTGPSSDQQSTSPSNDTLPGSQSPAEQTSQRTATDDSIATLPSTTAAQEPQAWTPVSVYTLGGTWFGNFTAPDSRHLNSAHFLESDTLENVLNASFAQGTPTPRLASIQGFVGWRKAKKTTLPPTEAEPELVKSFVDSAGGIATLTVVAVVLVFIILLLTKRLHDEYTKEKDTAGKDVQPMYDGWQHGLYPTDLGNDGQMLTFANDGGEEGEYDDIEMQRMNGAWQQYYGDMYSDAATEETAVGESEVSWESDDALLMEEAAVHSPIYDNSHQLFYGANYMQAQASTVYADQAYMSGDSEGDFDTVYDNVRRPQQGSFHGQSSVYDNRQNVMAANIPSTLHEVMKTFFSGEDYLVHGSDDSEEEDGDEDDGQASGGAVAGAMAGRGEAADGDAAHGMAHSPSDDVFNALHKVSLADHSMAEAEL
eukprot:scpid247/ scgid25797/ Protocadherin Fat 4; Cadherin family member 14; FAT tumor suppressor homolog 4; Fat-like cadherin protein FAT-J